MHTRIFIPIVVLISWTTAFGQIKHVAGVQSMGGGLATGGNYTSMTVVGEFTASDEIAQQDTSDLYPGFIPGFIVFSFGLKRDSVILASIYEGMGGEDWFTQGGWLTQKISNWSGVTISNQRVSGLSLPDNNVQNNLPEVIKNLSKLEILDLSDNEVRKLPNMSGMPNLSTLKVEENRLGFQSLIWHLPLDSFTYSPQKRYGYTENDTLEAGQEFTIKAMIPGATSYQWVFDDFADPEEAVNVSGATGTTLKVDSLIYDNMGAYRLTATSTDLPDLTIETRNHNVWATTDITGSVYADDQGGLLTHGTVQVYRIFEEGPYQLSDSATLDSEGAYLIEDLVLGDFVLLVKNDLTDFPDVIQTYYESTEDWLNADTLVVRSAVEAVDIEMIFKPDPASDPAGADFQGIVYSELPPADTVIDEEARGMARAAAKRAGCSMRRTVSSGRDDASGYELYAYVESDENGYFSFTDVEDGEYVLNIQYPGIPMDPDAAVNFTVGGDKENQVFAIEAVITEKAITVESNEILYARKPYLKDVNLYPNPTAGILTADYLVYRKLDDLKVQLWDLKGALLGERPIDASMGVQQVELDLTAYRDGLYLMVFTDHANTFKHEIKIIKQ